jgi:hypothetical protein
VSIAKDAQGQSSYGRAVAQGPKAARSDYNIGSGVDRS